MSGPFGSSQFMYETGAAEEGQSLRFEDGDSPSFSFTFGTPTNQIKWTMSFWCKRGEIGREHAIYGAANGGGETFFVAFYPDDIEAYISSGRNHVTNAVFRDPSAWYHIVQVFDSANATADDRFITYVNGVRQTTSTNSVALNDTTAWNTSGVTGYFGKNYGAWFGDSRDHFDGYLANVTFIDGQALDPTSFGEYEDTLWKPKSDADITSLTFGTNGFYLPFKQTTEAEGFSTVTYTGTSSQQAIEGVGFEPDLIWVKRRDGIQEPSITDSVRGVGKQLRPAATNAESSNTDAIISFDSNGFTMGADATNRSYNYYTDSHVAWCWDAGSGSAVSNTDGSITSSVKANTAKGFSIVSYTGTGANATVGHGLSSAAPEMIIVKNRTSALGWPVYHSANGATKFMQLEITNAVQTASTVWQDTAPTSNVFSVGTSTYVNQSSSNFIAYCFHSVSGYSSIGSYTGTGATGNSITGLGFKPAFVMIKRTDDSGHWNIYDNTRSPVNPTNKILLANSSNSEASGSAYDIDFDSDGFTINNTDTDRNASGSTYIYMAFADTRDATFFGDTSGNGNNWTPNALNNTDVVPDSPVTGGNFCVLDPNYTYNNGAGLSNGNLVQYDTTSNWTSAAGTFSVSSGKWYYETKVDNFNNSSIYSMVGLAKIGSGNVINNAGYYSGSTATSYGLLTTGNIYNNNTLIAYASALSNGDIVGVALDLDAGTLTYYINNVSQGTAFSGLSGEFFPVSGGYSGSINYLNFGQDSSFAGTETPQGNADDNGVGDFYYAPPSGFLALTTGNLPTPTITAPDDYFDTLLFTGNGSTQSITGLGWQSDFTWIKMRSDGTRGHALFDAVRGGTERLDSSSAQEGRTNEGNISFDADGFSVTSSHPTVNDSGDSAVAWNWLAGGTAVSNTDGSITSQVSANQTAGFSIVSYVADGTNTSTVGHGLPTEPKMVIQKDRSAASDWLVYTDLVDGSDDYLLLNSTAAKGNAAGGATATVFNSWDRTSGNDMIAYCFAEVEGYSKIGTYTGNGSTDGTYVHCGLRPAWIMVKRTDAASSNGWYIYDNKRENYGTLVDAMIYANLSNAEDNGGRDLDFTANGFKPRLTDVNVNASGGSYIFLAFAEAPFKSANAR